MLCRQREADNSGTVVVGGASRRRIYALPSHSHRLRLVGRQVESEEGVSWTTEIDEGDAIAIERGIALTVGSEQDQGAVLCGGRRFSLSYDQDTLIRQDC